MGTCVPRETGDVMGDGETFVTVNRDFQIRRVKNIHVPEFVPFDVMPLIGIE